MGKKKKQESISENENSDDTEIYSDNENNKHTIDDNQEGNTNNNDEQEDDDDHENSEPFEEPLFKLKEHEPIPETETVGNNIAFLKKSFADLYQEHNQVKEHLNKQHAIKKYKKIFRQIKDVVLSDDEFETAEDKVSVIWSSKRNRRNIITFAKKIAEQNPTAPTSAKLLKFAQRTWSRYNAKDFKSELVRCLPTIQSAIAKLYR